MCPVLPRSPIIVPIHHHLVFDHTSMLFEHANTELLLQGNTNLFDHFELYNFNTHFLKPFMQHNTMIYVVLEKLDHETVHFQHTLRYAPITYGDDVYAVQAIFVGTHDQLTKNFLIKRLVRFNPDYVPYMEIERYRCVPVHGNTITHDERVFWEEYNTRYSYPKVFSPL